MKLLKAITIGLCTFTILTGCQEENPVNGPSDLLTSTIWKLTAYGTDLNLNNILDKEEDAILECQKDNTYVFFTNGTGHYSDNTILCATEGETDFNWKLLSDSVSLEIGFEQFSIIRLAEHELVLKHNSQAVTHKTILRYTPGL